MEVVENKNLEQQLVEAEEKVKKLRKQLFEKNIRPITELLELNSGYVTKELICILVKATQDYIKDQKAIEFSLEKAEEITEIIEPVDDNIIPKEPIEDPIEAPQEGEEVSKVIDEEVVVPKEETIEEKLESTEIAKIKENPEVDIEKPIETLKEEAEEIDIDEEEKLPPLPKVIKELYFYARKSEEGNMEFYGVSNKKLLVKGKISSVPENMSLPVIELLGFTSLDQKIKNCKVKKIFIDNKHIINKWSKGEGSFCFLKEKAINNYFYSILSICGYYAPDICLEQMNRVANIIVNNFYKDDIPNVISQEKLEEILSYLDNKYEFLEKFNPFIYSIIEYKSKNYDSLLGVRRFPDKGEFEYNIFLFDVKDNKSPVYIFFHELGHYIHSNITNGKLYIPEDIILKLKDNGINIENMEEYQKNDFFADILAIGLMYGSPYEKEDPFFKTKEKNKNLFKDIVNKLLVLRK